MPEPAESNSAGPVAPARKLPAAFAELLGGSTRGDTVQLADTPDETPALSTTALAVTPVMVLEGVLFVGLPDNAAITAEQVAAALGEQSPADIAQLVDQLNEL